MKNYLVTGPGGGTYTVTLDDSGVVRVDGLFPSSAELLKHGVNRFMTRNKISSLRALSLVAGSYSWVTEVSIGVMPVLRSQSAEWDT